MGCHTSVESFPLTRHCVSCTRGVGHGGTGGGGPGGPVSKGKKGSAGPGGPGSGGSSMQYGYGFGKH